ncbi:MAG: DUF2064 domain-containing protein [Methylotenera sp.]|nr:DUF2064 domain-containing protein [Oligoflexia bacterium]
MTGKRCAVAIFVKTPGLSPLKTRLAEGIGKEAAEKFHELSARATEEAVETAAVHLDDAVELELIWAVAEQEGLNHPLWARHPTLLQGEGGLGERLAQVYSSLLQTHEAVIFLGADAPHLVPTMVSRAVTSCLQSEGYVVGPASDGGFYLFGCRHPIAPAQWQSVGYSSSETLSALEHALFPYNRTETLPVLGDVDTRADFQAVHDHLSALTDQKLLASQKQLLTFMGHVLQRQ